MIVVAGQPGRSFMCQLHDRNACHWLCGDSDVMRLRQRQHLGQCLMVAITPLFDQAGRRRGQHF
jgi:hypothetical protein